jgi:hypothetical protein
MFERPQANQIVRYAALLLQQSADAENNSAVLHSVRILIAQQFSSFQLPIFIKNRTHQQRSVIHRIGHHQLVAL